MTTRSFDWPSRERWAYPSNTPYWDSDTGCPYADKYGHRLSDYATPHEVAVLTAELKNLYRELGRELRAVNLRIKPSDRQQRGEGHAAWYRRFRQLPPEDQELFNEAANLKSDRQQINDLLKRIADDAIPDFTRGGSVIGRPAELVAPFLERYDAAFKAAREQWEQECLQIPVDDAAWEKELEWRAGIERRWAKKDEAA